MKRTFVLLIAVLAACMVGAKPVKTRLKISNATSKASIERAIRKISGVTDATFDLSTKILVVTYDNKKTNTSKVRAGVKKAGYVIGSFASPSINTPTSRKEQKASGRIP